MPLSERARKLVSEGIEASRRRPLANAPLADRLEYAATWGGATESERRELLTEAARFIRQSHGEAA